MKNILSWYENKHILITGASGYIGSSVIKALDSVNCKISTLSRSGKINCQSSNIYKQITGNICDDGIWSEALDASVDIVIYLASQTSVYIADKNPVEDQKVNLQSLLAMLNFCHDMKLKPFVVLASTVTISGLPKNLPVTDDYPDHPITIYDLHKKMAETYLNYFIDLGFLKGTSLRLANVYGPGPASSSQDRGILNLMVKRALSGQTLTVYGEGNYLRDYIYIDDVTAAFLSAAPHAEAVNGKHFMITSGAGTKLIDALRLVARTSTELTNKSVEISHVPEPEGLSPIELRNFIGDSSAYSKATQWKPNISIDAGIRKTLESFL